MCLLHPTAKKWHLLWVQTEGIYLYENNKMQHKWYGDNISGFIRSMAQDDNGTVWLSSDEKV